MKGKIMEVNIIAVVAATVAMFAVGAFWYMVPFAKPWGRMHGFDKLTKDEQKKAQKEVGPLYGYQLLVTIVSAIAMSSLLNQMPNVSLYKVVFMIWIGFVMPAQVSSVIFSTTKKSDMCLKIFILTAETLVHLLVAAWVINLIQK
jgi:Protein of unknown function (DUF1761)